MDFNKLFNITLRNILTVIRLIYPHFSRKQKHYLLISSDAILLVISIHSALMLRFEQFQIPNYQNYAGLAIALIAIKLIFFKLLGLYRSILTYSGSEFILVILQAIIYSSGIIITLAYFLTSRQLPRSVILIDAAFSLILITGSRLFMRRLLRNFYLWMRRTTSPQKRVIIYGASEAGLQLAQSLKTNPEYKVVGFVDENPSVHHHQILGIPVYSAQDIPILKQKKKFNLILLALPHLSGKSKCLIIEQLQHLSLPIRTIPTMAEIVSGQISISKVREIDILDLLGREQVAPQIDLLGKDITGKSVLVTGAGGSIGSELCRQIVAQKPKCLVLYELSEFALYNIDMELGETYPEVPRVSYLGSVNDQQSLNQVLTQYQVDTVYHAAAYKHVPLVETNPGQGIINNVKGTLTVASCAQNCHVKKFVLISTDKAVRPTNIMGATKRVAELILQALADEQNTQTCFTIVRFGNVLGSSGSVVPRFRKQIVEGYPITLTHPDMTRYFMSIPEAASLVIQAGAMSQGGEVFLLDMGEPVRIYDLAVQMIQLSGLKPEEDIPIQITGLRPGEKIYEELLIDCTKAKPTQHPKIFCGEEPKFPWSVLEPSLEKLFMQAYLNNQESIKVELKKLVPGYQKIKHTVQEETSEPPKVS